MAAEANRDGQRWITTSTVTIQDCSVFTVDKITCERAPVIAENARSDQHGKHDFFVLNSPDFVNIVALTDLGDCVLVEQWRHGTQALTLEIPGGLVDADETAEQAARRELREETGFEAERWIEIGLCRPNAAIQSNYCTTFLALGAVKRHDTAFDAHEDCVLRTMPWPEVVARVADGRIDHALVVAAVLYARLHLASA